MPEYRIVPLFYERDVTAWLKSRFPQMQWLAIVEINHNAYHIVVSSPDAAALEAYLFKDLSPPCRRRTLDAIPTPQSEFEPGILFNDPVYEASSRGMQRKLAEYKSLIEASVNKAQSTLAVGSQFRASL